MGSFLYFTTAVITCISVKSSCATCEGGRTDNVFGVYGQNTTLSCRGSSSCTTIPWSNETKGAFITLSDTNHTSVVKDGTKSVLRIWSQTLEDDGSYECWCYRSGIPVGNFPICTIKLETICEARVSVNHTTYIYNSSTSSTGAPYVLDATEHSTLNVECHKDALLETTCALKTGGEGYKNNIMATSHCNVLCTLNSLARSTTCDVQIFIQVQPLPSFHQTTTVKISATSFGNYVPTRSPLPIIFPLIIVVLVLLVIAVALCVYIYYPKFNKRSKFRRHPEQFYPSYNAEAAPTYAMVDRNSDTDKSAGREVEVGDAVTDSSYTYVNIRNVSDQQDAQRVQPSVANNLYSEADKSNETGQALGQDAMEHSPQITHEVYTEVNNPERGVQSDVKTAPGENKTDRGYEKISDILGKDNQGAEDPNLSLSDDHILDYEEMHNDAPDVNESAGLYAVVDKTKDKSQQE